MKEYTYEISKEEYEKGKNSPSSLISESLYMGYGVYGAQVFEIDGKYYLRYSTGDSCD